MPKLYHTFVSAESDSANAGLIRPSNWNAPFQYGNAAGTGPSGTDVLVREQLTANRTYFVRTDGNDSNTGLVNSAGGAFLTIAKGLTVAASLDCGGFTVTVQIGDGTWTVPVVLPTLINGSGILQGNVGTPANCLISVTGSAIRWGGVAATAWIVTGFKLVASQKGILANGGGANIEWQVIDFGACSQDHVVAGLFGTAFTVTDYTITGDAPSHIRAYQMGFVGVYNATTTATGTRTFSTAFATAAVEGFIEASAPAYAGTYVGSRYFAELNGVIQTYGGGANFFPGDAVGTTATGGQYA